MLPHQASPPRRRRPSHHRDVPHVPRPAWVARTPLTLLVVDDAADTRYIYERYFQFRGARVVTASDGIEALHCVEVDRPDAIVLDLAMPRVTGWDVIRDLKANLRTRSIPVVVLSGQEARESALGLGADSYLEKPCTPEDLLREILRVLRDPGGAARDQ